MDVAKKRELAKHFAMGIEDSVEISKFIIEHSKDVDIQITQAKEEITNYKQMMVKHPDQAAFLTKMITMTEKSLVSSLEAKVMIDRQAQELKGQVKTIRKKMME